ncbi:MAG: tetratricopeptide repeat protein, partial [Planctomycetales bacterium]|nr:tetratricopeptide repeat protein [Planctomycetales bacterium]
LLNQLDKAAAAFEAVISQNPATPEETSQRLDAMLAKAKVLSRQAKHPEALKLLQEVIKASPPEDSHLQAEAALRQGECLEAQGKDKEALFAFLRVDVLFGREKAAHAEALFHLQKLWGKAGQPTRAEEARAKLESEFPNSEWTKRLKTPGA